MSAWISWYWNSAAVWTAAESERVISQVTGGGGDPAGLGTVLSKSERNGRWGGDTVRRCNDSERAGILLELVPGWTGGIYAVISCAHIIRKGALDVSRQVLPPSIDIVPLHRGGALFLTAAVLATGCSAVNVMQFHSSGCAAARDSSRSAAFSSPILLQGGTGGDSISGFEWQGMGGETDEMMKG